MNEEQYSGPLDDTDGLAKFLRSRRFGRQAAAAKAALFGQCAATLRGMTSATSDHWRAYWVPGRIEVLGKHTDYAGGSSIVAAAERGFCLVAADADDPQVLITDAAREETALVSMTENLDVPAGHWSHYPGTVVRRLTRNFPGAERGTRIALASDLPAAAGMSSSSALMTAIFFALADANELWSHPNFPSQLHQPLQLAAYMATVENGQSYEQLAGDTGVGTFGGSEDHTAILCARPSQLRQFAYCPVRHEHDFPVPEGYTMAVASSGVVAEKTGAARDQYNRASQLVGTLAELWRQSTGRSDPHLAAALRSHPDAARQLEEILVQSQPAGDQRDALQRRLDHFLAENEDLIPTAGRALREGDLDCFAQCVDRSQHVAEHLLGNQVPETCYLAAAAREAGALAACSFGAGFGGSVWALVAVDRADAMLAAWRDGYRARFPDCDARAQFFLTAAGPALFRLK